MHLGHGYSVALSLFCLAAVAGLLFAEWRGWKVARAMLKMSASTSFVLVALVLGAVDSTYGRLLLAGLVLGWFGDALLLSRRSGPFLAGLAAFLASHLSFAGAFLSGPFSLAAFALACVPALALGFAITRWLWPHLAAAFKPPVVAYVVAIFFMCAAAAGFGAASGVRLAPLGAVLFAVSDIAVARDRFVAKGLANKAWGWPAYFAAQLALAWSVAESLAR